MGIPKKQNCPVLRLRLGIHFHQILKNVAQELNQKPSTLAGMILKTVLNDNERGEVQLTDFRRDNVSTDLHIGLSSDEMDMLEYYAANLGLSRSKTVASVLRAVFIQHPLFTSKERQVLAESNRQLRSIGINLNQLVRTVHELKNNANNYDLQIELIQKLEEFESKFCTVSLNQEIRNHTEKVYDVINLSRKRISMDSADLVAGGEKDNRDGS